MRDVVHKVHFSILNLLLFLIYIILYNMKNNYNFEVHCNTICLSVCTALREVLKMHYMMYSTVVVLCTLVAVL